MGVHNIDGRRDRRMAKEKKSKEYLSIHRELNRLRTAKRSHELVELPKPVRKGWKRFFVLRPDIEKSREADFFKGLLKLVNTTVYSRNQEFMAKDWKTKKIKPIPQGIHKILPKVYNALTPKQKSYFHEANEVHNKKLYLYYAIEEAWRFVYKVEPHYVTHSFVLYPEVESQYARLNNKINSELLWSKIFKAMSKQYNGGRDYIDIKTWMIEKSIDAETRKTLIECDDYFIDEIES